MGNLAAYQHSLLRNEQSALADQYAEAHGIATSHLMQQAGLAVARSIQARYTPRATLVLCGPGNNGGDGFVVATLLREAGWAVKVSSIDHQLPQSSAASLYAQSFIESNKDSLLPFTEASLQGIELVVDAIFGAGLNRPLGKNVGQLLNAVALHKIPVVAIDVPSGINGNSGEDSGAIACQTTVTFFCKKPAHVLYPAKSLCGEVILCPIDIPSQALEHLNIDTWENNPALWIGNLPILKVQGHKYQRGHAYIDGGYPMTGAARLAAMACARIGAGLTSVMVPAEAFNIYATSLLSVLVHPIADLSEHQEKLKDTRFTACLVGPGAGVVDLKMQSYLISKVLAVLATGKPTVLDADALTVFATSDLVNAHPLKQLDQEAAIPVPKMHHGLRTLCGAIHGPLVITPHEGEFKRLFGEAISADLPKLERARLAATLLKAIVVLKGADTIIAAPDGRAIINSNAPATLATAGAGDVLAGMITGLLSQGMPAFEAAAAAVWMHAEAANHLGKGLIADDLVSAIPTVLNALPK